MVSRVGSAHAPDLARERYQVPASAALLLLADSRLPAGGHAHSGGVEAAVGDGTVRDTASLAAFLAGRLATAGLTAAALAAAVTAVLAVSGGRDRDGDAAALGALDAEADARTPSPALRTASRAQGRALLRAGRAAFPDVRCPLAAPHHPVALGAVARAGGLAPADAALAGAYGAVAGPASAAVRLLGLDPLAVTGLLAALTREIDRVAAAAAEVGWAVGAGRLAARDLPAPAAPRLELLAERHRTAAIRLFAS